MSSLVSLPFEEEGQTSAYKKIPLILSGKAFCFIKFAIVTPSELMINTIDDLVFPCCQDDLLEVFCKSFFLDPF